MSASIYMLACTRKSINPLRFAASTNDGITELWIRDADNTVSVDLSRAEVCALMAVLALATEAHAAAKPVAVAVAEAA